MKKGITGIFLSVCVLTILPSVAAAQSTEFSAALKRMDAIIAEMTALRTEFAKLATSVGVSAPASAVQGATSGGVLGDDVAYGSTNEDIARIQRLLATDSEIYPYGVDSGFYGPKTQEAVRRFQSRFNLSTVGVVGPSTRALLEVFFAAYPDENYPEGVLKKAVPTVAGAQTTTVQPAATAPTVSPSNNVLKSISLDEDDGEYIVRSYKANGTRNRDLILYPDDEDDLIEMIADKLGASESEVRSLVDADDLEFGSKRDSDDADKEDAEDAIEDADDAIDDARDAIRDADDDGDDIDDADELYDDARDEYKKAKDALDDKDYENAVKNAEDAIELAEEAVGELDGKSSKNNDDIDVIEVTVKDGEARVKVEYDDGDDERFTVDEDEREDIIDAIADELDLDKDDVEDLAEFDYGSLESIFAERDEGKTRVVIKFESGVKVKLVLSEDEDDEIIEEIADELDLDEDDVKKVYDSDL